MTIILFVVILAILIIVHELGHFLIAKWSGIRVDEFGLGFPPRLVGWKRGETTYSLNALPFGGFVRIFGEDPGAEVPKEERTRNFGFKPKSIQTLVLAGGILFNIVFAWLLISLGFMTGMPVPEGYSAAGETENIQVLIAGVANNSPANYAGLQAGDSIVSLQAGDQKIDKFSVDDIRNFMAANANQKVSVEYIRNQETATVDVVPVVGIGSVTDRATIGVTLQVVGTLKVSFFRALWEGAKLTYDLTIATVVGLYQFLSRAVIGQAQLSEVTGPVGIANLVGDASRLGFVYLLSFTAFISINLAVINFIPFPALDGGRILFVLIEKIKGTPINPKVANVFNAVGFFLLIGLMLIVTYHDITLLFS